LGNKQSLPHGLIANKLYLPLSFASTTNSFSFRHSPPSRISPTMNIHPSPDRDYSFSMKSIRLHGPLLAAAICGLLLASCNRSSGPAAPAAVEVATIVVAPQSVALTTELPGRTAAFRVAEIRPQVNGLIQKRLFTEGSEVAAGQELYQIDPAQYQAAFDSAKAALGRAEANIPAARARAERFEGLAADKAVSQQNFDDATAALQQAEADVAYYKATAENAHINLGYTKITSPISGRIGRSSVTDGAIVTAYQPVPLATIQQLDPIYVDVPQSTDALLRLERRLAEKLLSADATDANKVQLYLSDGSKYPIEGTLQFRDVEVDPTTASVTLRAVFSNPDGVLLPSMFVRAVVTEGVNDHAILVPQQSVTRDTKGNPIALIVNAQKKVELRQLSLDRAIGNRWLVASGLAVGDHVIAEGLQKIRPGAEVREVPFQAASPTSAQPTPATK
jgi:membrane fusion protein, multidrug efflux system